MSSHAGGPQSPLQPLNTIHAVTLVLGLHSSSVSGQDAIDFNVTDFVVRLFLVIVDVCLFCVPQTDSLLLLLLVANSSSSASATT